MKREGVYKKEFGSNSKNGPKNGLCKEWYQYGQLYSERVYTNGIEVIPEPEVVKQRTTNDCLIYKEPPTPDQRYLVCSFTEDHVMNHQFMAEFRKTSKLRDIKCVYCNHVVKSVVYEQTE